MDNRRKQDHLLVLGDSLTDRGMLAERKLLGLFSLKKWSGLDQAALNRFSDGYVWLDFLAKMLVDDFQGKTKAMRHIHNPRKRYEAYLEAMNEDTKLDGEIKNSDERVTWHRNDFVRSYAEGGLTTTHYYFTPKTTFVKWMSRSILARLHDMRVLIANEDAAANFSNEHKANSIVIEWSGANDLITINDGPTNEEADIAVAARIRNAKKLIKFGYRHFILFGLPDFSLTPRFQALSNNEQQNAHACSDYFNDQLTIKCAELQAQYPHCKISVLDLNKQFVKIYNNPGKYGLDPDEKNSYFIRLNGNTLNPGDEGQPGHGFMFWNDVHPSEATHFHLAEGVCKEIKKLYQFVEPGKISEGENLSWKIDDETLIAAFKLRYLKVFGRDQTRFFTGTKHSYIHQKLDNLTLEDIFEHALNNDGKRTYKVLQDLQWIDSDGQLNLQIAALKGAMHSTTLSPKSVVL